MDDADLVTLVVWLRGQVQGVGFRWWTRARALELGLVGSATNLDDGTVEVRAHGAPAHCRELLTLLTEQPPRPAPARGPRSWYDRPGSVTGATVHWAPAAETPVGFVER